MTREELLKIAKPVLFNTQMVIAILEDRKGATRRAVKPQPENDAELLTDNLLPETEEAGAGKIYAFSDGTVTCPKYNPGDILYVRETWSDHYVPDEDGKPELQYCYKADGINLMAECLPGETNRWYPSIHMPKEAARLFLKVTDVRVERLQDITEEQAKAEGISRLFDYMSDKDFEDRMRSLGQSEKTKSDWGYKNYLWHGDYGTTGQGNKKTDNWDYQYSAYDSAVDSFSSLWNTTVELKDWDKYGWEANPWVWIVEFERVEV